MKNQILYILFSFHLLCGYLTAEEPTWQVTGKMKYPVSGAQSVVRDSLVYVIGGYSDSLQANVRWIQQFNPVSGEWSIVANMIEKRYGFFAGIHDDKLYIYGGINEVNPNSFNLEEWDFGSPNTVVHNENELFDRVFSTGTVYKDNLLMIGGYAASRGSNANLPYIANFDFHSMEISSVDDTSFTSNALPVQQMSVAVNDNLFLFGGSFNGVLQNYDIIQLENLSRYSVGSRIITPRAAGVAVYSSYSDLIYLIGGYNETTPAVASLEVISNYDTYPLVSAGSQLNYARRNHAAVVLNEKIYVFGGENASGKVIDFIEEIYAGPVSVVEESELIKNFSLSQNYPNPFNPETNISFTLQKSMEIQVEIYNTLGEKIITLVDGSFLAGNHSIKWNGSNQEGKAVPTGVYLYSLIADHNFITKKMLLLR